MTGRLYTPADLAEMFGKAERTVMEWRIKYRWPSITVGQTVRFTQAQVDEILERHSQTAAPAEAADPSVGVLPGQSRGSAARKKAS